MHFLHSNTLVNRYGVPVSQSQSCSFLIHDLPRASDS